MKDFVDDEGTVTMCSGWRDGKVWTQEVPPVWSDKEEAPDSPYARQVGGDHYQGMAIQPHEYIVKNKLGWSAGNAIKYLSRYKMKGGAADLRKAIHYCELALREEYPGE